MNEQQKEEYYQRLIKPQADEASLEAFVNAPDIQTKLPLEIREEFVERWLIDHGFTETMVAVDQTDNVTVVELQTDPE